MVLTGFYASVWIGSQLNAGLKKPCAD